MEISNVLTSIGGTATAFKLLILGLFSIFIYKEWELSIVKDCMDDQNFKIFDKNKTKMQENIARYNYTLQEIKNRVSFKGLYKLYDQIKDVFNYIETDVLP